MLRRSVSASQNKISACPGLLEEPGDGRFEDGVALSSQVVIQGGLGHDIGSAARRCEGAKPRRKCAAGVRSQHGEMMPASQLGCTAPGPVQARAIAALGFLRIISGLC